MPSSWRRRRPDEAFRRRSGSAAEIGRDEECRLTVLRRGLEAAALVLLMIASHGAGADPDPLQERTEHVIVYGDDACPKPADDEEIVVCGRRPENERYRIPKSLRGREPSGETSWTSRTEDMERASRDSMPGSCSVVGSYGQSGCHQQLINQWYRDRRAARSGPAR